MTDLAPDIEVDLDACAAEPIRIPGGIQPHGALAVVDPDSFEILQASTNLAEVLGAARAEAGMALADLASPRLLSELGRWRSAGEPVFLRALQVGGRQQQVVGHLTPQGLILEFEAPPAGGDETLEALYPRLRAFVDATTSLPTVQAVAEAAVREVRSITGFNRVMLYEFDAEGVGTVLAEDGDGVLPSHLGQRFPASDIPQQARELYRTNRLRLIPTADYTPSEIEPPLSPVNGQPLDLSLAGLRSVSPVHLQYMRNMGTRSSMSISILVDGRLWGLVSGHSAAPHRVNVQVRTACDFLGQIISLQIGARERGAEALKNIALKRRETELVAALARAPSFKEGLVANAERWMGLTGAQGAAVVTDGTLLTVGLTPPEPQIEALVERLRRANRPVTALDSIADGWPEAREFAGAASGVLAVSISQIHPDYILWFRPEVIRTIDWAGDPNKPVDPGTGGLSPRHSFAVWREQVRCRSLPWDQPEIDAAVDLRNSIVNFVLRRAEERAELSGELERSNRELESFSYSISHDLRAPFRHIVGYAELLADREKSMDEKSQHYLRSIVDAALSAGRLVDDLLAFSQMGRASLHKTRIDMRKLVDEVRRALEPDVLERDIEWRIGDLPPAWGDGALVRQVMFNLVENAVKYSRGRTPAVIEVTGEDLDGRTRYTVRDNGVGFDMAYVGKLFGVFQRLHRVEDFEGTGIGLALAQRVVERHGGTISADSTLGEGATFTFVMPKRDEEKRQGDVGRG